MADVKVLMVCLGNICRSPLAEGILQSKVSVNKVMVDSAGTAAYHVGNKPDIRSIAVAKKHGLDIASQRARQFHCSDFELFDIIYAMDENNYQNILSLAPNQSSKSKVKLILKEIPSFHLTSVPDPYYGGGEGFEEVYQMLNKACDIIAEKIIV